MKKSPVYFGHLMSMKYKKITTTSDLYVLSRNHGSYDEAVFDGTLAKLLDGIDIRDELDKIISERLSREETEE